MSEVVDLARDLWLKFRAEVSPEQLVDVIMAVTTGIKETASGKATSVLASVEANAPQVATLIRDVAQEAAIFVAGPLAGGAVDIAFDLLATSHSMSPQEEAAWMARQGSGN